MTMRSIIDTIMKDESPEVDADLGIDTALDVLGNQRRRHVIDVLAQREQGTTHGLRDALASIEYDDPSHQERKRVYVALYQTHLPTMVDADVLEQRDEHEFAPGPAFEPVVRVLEAVREVTV